MARRGRPRKGEAIEKYTTLEGTTIEIVALPTDAQTADELGIVPAPVADVVAKLEEQGAVKVADTVHTLAGLPPRRLSRAEEFVREVERQVTGGPVYFHADTPEEALEWVALAKELPYPKPSLKYHAKVTTPPTRIEVSLVGG